MEGRVNFLEAWFECYGSTPIAMRRVLDDINNYSSSLPIQVLREAVNDLFPKGAVTSVALAGFARRIQQRHIGGFLIESVRNESNHNGTHGKRWQVVRA